MKLVKNLRASLSAAAEGTKYGIVGIRVMKWSDISPEVALSKTAHHIAAVESTVAKSPLRSTPLKERNSAGNGCIPDKE